jgi:hypothetical protein
MRNGEPQDFFYYINEFKRKIHEINIQTSMNLQLSQHLIFDVIIRNGSPLPEISLI